MVIFNPIQLYSIIWLYSIVLFNIRFRLQLRLFILIIVFGIWFDCIHGYLIVFDIPFYLVVFDIRLYSIVFGIQLIVCIRFIVIDYTWLYSVAINFSFFFSLCYLCCCLPPTLLLCYRINRYHIKHHIMLYFVGIIGISIDILYCTVLSSLFIILIRRCLDSKSHSRRDWTQSRSLVEPLCRSYEARPWRELWTVSRYFE